MNKDVIIALDFNSKDETLNFLNKFDEKKIKPFIKIGMELYYKEGFEFVRDLKEKGYKIFLDLKLHDIPMTVYKALKVLKPLDVDIINVHAFGGRQMLEKAKEAFEGTNTKVIAVTMLTSLDENDLKDLNINNSCLDNAVNLAMLTKECGLDGIVCSAKEVKAVKEKLGQEVITVTPGIRTKDDNQDDQKRVVTPLIAKEINTDYIVVGRSITKDADPVEKYLKIKKDFMGEK